jgi:hypothetical protein
LVKSDWDGQLIIGPVAWLLEYAGWGYEYHALIGFFASKEEAEARAALVKPDDPDMVKYGDDYKEGERRVRALPLRQGSVRVRPKEVWACLLSARACYEVVHAVCDRKVGGCHG